MLILIAGPYRGGTNDDPKLIQKNLEKLEAVALPLFRMGHLPIIGEWLALPLLHLAGSKHIGDSVWDEIQYPVAHRLLEKCDAVLRLEGESKGADNDVRIATERGLKIYYKLEDIPNVE
ncbi:NUDIX hydrolase [Flavobacteriaceae bacterium CRH]|nr:NUDIX hydrolase [Flavobacteriaceae bacterium CRH]